MPGHDDDDLDAFLTQLESKLRGPFSGADLAKTIQVEAVRGTSCRAYLHRVAQVLSRAEKSTQLRCLIGLAGIEPAEETDAEMDTILQNAQEAPLREEWVRVVAGLVEGILFEGEETSSNERGAAMGKEARDVLTKTCSDVLRRVREALNETADEVHDEEESSRLARCDADPTLAPYRYALIPPEQAERIIPELTSHHHFTVNKSADILSMDAKLELQKAQEEQEHLQVKPPAKPSQADNKAAPTQPAVTPIMPGVRFKKTSTKAANAQQQRPKSSMFMPSKRPGAATGAAKPTKTVLQVRKKGAAQALLAKGRRNRPTQQGAAGQGQAAKTGKFAGSRMKMLDVAEVQGLQQKETAGNQGDKLLARQKRKLEKTVATEPPEKKARAKTDDRKTAPTAEVEPAKVVPPKAAAVAATDLATAALSAYQAQRAGGAASEKKPVPEKKQQDWQQMLQERSNRVSADDRFRIQQFFVDHFNPTPDQKTYKMKLHEERTTDPKTGEPVKVSYYLELDYTTFTSKQSKKTKRYKDG
jgi:hypothetical protein